MRREWMATALTVLAVLVTVASVGVAAWDECPFGRGTYAATAYSILRRVFRLSGGWCE